MSSRKKPLWKRILIPVAILLAGALFKNKVLGMWKKIPVVGKVDLEDKIGDNAKS
ncbi:hypothetical protein [Flagellimonas sp. CMM7]|uniref:hypothetical protein n=1 Tax=Flagellimonas sp. CMM7 TaxID=2654676 RepID=UPI0013D53BA4|nr:hypothetical protein [Flagellimonas sp. CMM7]UII79562.1 hypothetical protein LV704_18115 [Flagellimonas sp. CMM7]